MEWISAGDGRLAASSELADAVAHIRAADLLPECEKFRAQVLELVEAHPGALHRSCTAGHLTGSAVVVDPARQQTLLILHRKLGRWFQPGGHADGDGNLAAVALKEATEETGIAGLRVATPALDLDIHDVPLPDGHHLHLDLRFLVLAPPNAEAPGNHESIEVRWVSPEDLPALGVDPGTTRLVTRALKFAHPFFA